MKILHVTALSPFSPNSGIPAVLKCLSDGQNNIDGVEARVLSLVEPIDEIHSDSFDWLKSYGSLDKYFTVYLPDVVIFHGYQMEYSSVARVLKRKSIPFLVEPHGSFGKMAMRKSYFKKLIANNTIYRPVLQGAAAFIYTNYPEQADTIYKSKPSTVIPNGVIEDVIHAAADKTEESIQSPIFYFLGRYDIHHKGLDYLLDALTILDNQGHNFTIRLYGTGDAKQSTFINESIKLYKNLDVRNCGTIYGTEKKEALEAANILLLTSRYEGSPMTILDALSYGNACLVTPGTNMAEELSINGIGWKVDLNPESIAKGIVTAYNEYKMKGEVMSRCCKEYVLEHYTWHQMAELSVMEYKRLIK